MSDELRGLRRQRRPGSRRQPSPWRRLAPVFAVAASLVICFAGIRALVLSRSLQARELEISGCRRVDRGEIASLAARALGRPLLLLDLDALRAEIEQVPEVRSVVVARRLPAMLDIRISERRAVARCAMAGGDLLVDADGHLFSRGGGLPGDDELPRIVGLHFGEAGRLLPASDRVALQALAAWKRVAGRNDLAGLSIDLSLDGRVALIEADGGLPLWLDRQDPSMNLEELYSRRKEIRSMARGRVVDLRFPHRLTIVPLTDGTRRR